MERNLQNERDPDRRREVAARIDREVRELERQISLCQTRDAVRDDQLDVWREGLYEELATQGEKQARLTLLNSWLKVIIHTRNHQPPKTKAFVLFFFFYLIGRCTTTLTAQAWAGPTSILRGAV
uniref:Orf123a n=1 Tax=Eruca vesicaria subsp. sativa TaxID=29727 RepID=A0A088BG26_ERUVS|nr:orf123a [Eruca vesicaria subsp. sativa]